jgi:hypothetical protein
MKDVKSHQTSFPLSFLSQARQYHAYWNLRASDDAHRLWMDSLGSHQCAGSPTGMVHELRPRRSDALAGTVGRDWRRSCPPRCLPTICMRICFLDIYVCVRLWKRRVHLFSGSTIHTLMCCFLLPVDPLQQSTVGNYPNLLPTHTQRCNRWYGVP